MKTSEAITIRRIANDDLPDRADLAGRYTVTDFQDTRGRLVSGRFVSAKRLDNGMIGVKIERYLDGRYVMDGAAVPAGNDPMGRPWRTSVHLPESVAALEEARA